MIIAKITGGLGNQLRIFSCGYTVSRYMNQPLILDISDYTSGYFRPYVLDTLSIPEYEKIYYPHTKAVYYCIDAAPDTFKKQFDLIISTDAITDRANMLSLCEGHRNIYIQGYKGITFCTEEEKETLKKWFRPKFCSAYTRDICDKLCGNESVAVHIRRTDFITGNWTDDSQEDYYRIAISYMRNHLKNPQFYFFSDDMAWVKRVFGSRPEYHYIRLVGGVSADIEELYIMTSCRHHILTDRSTYGWWGAFLSSYGQSINICNGNNMDEGISNLIIFDDITVYEKNLPSNRDICPEAYPIDQNACSDIHAEDEYDILLEKKATALLKNGAVTPEDMTSALPENSIVMPEAASASIICEDNAGVCGINSSDIGNINELLSIMDRLLPSRRDDGSFFLNYSAALFLAGRTYEAVLYAANAIRLDPAYKTPQWVSECSDEVKNIYFRLRDKLCGRQSSHYFFLNINIWENVKGFYDSLEIILRNIGNEVTLLECTIDTALPDSSFGEIMSSRTLLDATYDYGIEKYDMHCQDDNGFFPYAKHIIEQTRKHNYVIAVTHFAEGLICDISPYPIYYIDGYLEWDVWKYITDTYDDATFDAICRLSAKVFTARHTDFPTDIHRTNPQYTDPRYAAKIIEPHSARLVKSHVSDIPYPEADASDGCYHTKEPYTNYDCYMRNEDVIKEIIHIILNM